MKPIYLAVANHERFKLNPMMSKFTFKPEANTQILLGTNGSGKTSLLELLFGMPADQEDILEDGYIESKIDHNGHIYTLKSIRTPKGVKYKFYEDNGVNLNTAEKITVQRTLVNEYLGINKEILELMCGNDALTSMSKAKRKDWMMRSAKTDFTFVLSKYDEIRKALSVNKTILDHETKKLEQLMSSVSSVDDEITEEIDTLKKKLEELLLKKSDTLDHNTYSIDAYNKMLEELTTKVGKFSHKRKLLVRKYVKDLNMTTISHSHLVSEIHSLSGKAEFVEGSLNKMYTKLDEHNMKLDSKSNGLSRQEILDELSKITYEENELDLPSASVEVLERLLYMIEEGLKSYHTPLNTLDKITLINNNIVELKESKGRWEKSSDYETKKSKLAHYEHVDKHSDQIVCPECDAHFYSEEYDAEEYKRLAAEYKSSCDNDDIIDRKIEELLLQKGEDEVMYVFLRKLKDTNTRNDIPKVTLSPEFNLSDYYNGLLRMRTMYKAYVTNCHVKDYEKKLKATLVYYDEMDETLDNLKNNTIIELNNDIESAINRKFDIEAKKNIYSDLKDEYDSLVLLGDEIIELRERINTYREKAIVAERNAMLHTRIVAIKSRLHDLTAHVVEVETRATNIVEAKNVVASLKDKVHTLKELERTFGPKSGLIGNAVSSYMRAFIGLMNHHISQIWDYELELVMPPIERLDYSFPVRVEGSSKLRKDVSNVSNGQKEIIDLAYKLTMLQMLGYEGYPLVLDEFGSALDHVHREKSYRVISGIAQSNKYSTVYMVSHYSDLYGGMDSDVEYSILDDRNIVKNAIPMETNTALSLMG